MYMSYGIQVKKASKDILARAMAQEDITVQHSASAETAYFDTQNRVLCLPIWKDMDNCMYDMLVGHEVSHALHTPADGWQEFVGENGRKHMFLNVVEDARIERMIKDKFPGLRRDFASAYKSLNERDIFELAGKDLSKSALIDRLNIEFKTGLHCGVDVPFTADEKQYVTRMAETETFEDVMELAQELYEMQKEEDEKQQQEQSQQSPESGEGEGEGEGSATSDNSESGEGSGSASGAGDDESGDDESGSGSGDGDESSEDSGASRDDDTDDGESADSTQGDSSNGDADDLSYDDYENNVDAAGSTQRSFEKGVNDLRDTDSGEYTYNTLPTPNLENIVVDFKTISEMWDTQRAKFIANGKELQEAEQLTELHEYRTRIKGTVNQMVQQFQMKQAADADKKTEIAKTGVLDTVSMINYRWSEDIFLKNEIHPDGKNHGMIMYVDWSGSMSGILKDTVEQLIVLVEFCRKVNIPYEVYAFSSNEYVPECPHEDKYSTEYRDWYHNYRENHPQWKTSDDRDVSPHSFQLYNYLSSRMNKRQYQQGLQDFWLTTSACRYYGSVAPNCLSLGCTPLNEAVVCAMTQVPAFRAMHGIQIVNTVVLSDGEGHSMCRHCSYKGKRFVTDKKSKKSYEINDNQRGGETMALLEMLKDRTGCNTVGIRLHDSKHIKHLRYSFGDDTLFQKACKQYKNQNFTTLASSYDEYFLVKGDLKVETDAMESLDDDATYTRIKNAFMKGGNRKKSSRVIASRMVDIFAT